MSFKQPLLLGFSKAQRILKNSEFQDVYQSAQRGGSGLYTYHVQAADITAARLGVTVSKKVSKSAVVRNRIKRQVREFFRLHQDQLKGTKLVITARPGCAKATDAERAQALSELWQKVLKWRSWHERTQT